MIRKLAFAAALVAAGPASALTCVAPSVAGAYGAADDSPQNYVIAIGSLVATGPSDPPEGAVARRGDLNRMTGYTQPAAFTGTLFSGAGFDLPGSFPVTADVTCVAAWCGSYADTPDAMFFFRREADGSHVLEIGACPFFVFPNPTRAQRQTVISCYQNGGC